MRKALWTENTVPVYIGSVAAIVLAVLIISWVG
jgi:hypothetical protein